MSADPRRTGHGRRKRKRLEMRGDVVLVLLGLCVVIAGTSRRPLRHHGGREQKCARLARSLSRRAAYYGGGGAARGYCPTRCYQRYCQCPVSSCRRRCPYHKTTTSIYEGKDWYGPKYGESMDKVESEMEQGGGLR